MKCKNCGKEMPEGFQFCNGCGSQMQKESSSKMIFAIVAIVITVIVSVFIVGGAIVWGVLGSRGVAESRREEGERKAERHENAPAETEEEVTEELQESDSLETEELSGHTSDNALAGKIVQLNESQSSLPMIDIDADNYQAAERDTNAAWDESLFYTLEDVDKENEEDGLINNFSVSKKEFLNADTKNRVEYDIYTNPANQKVNKIVSIEYAGAQLLVTEYYYTDEGKVNFIYEYTDINYFPSFATPDRDGSRFYFNGDILTKWRLVAGGVQTNYVVGSRAAEVGYNAGNVILMSDFSANQQTAFDQKEQQMIDQAYNTYAIVLNTEGIAAIQGYVLDAQTNPVKEAKAVLYEEGGAQELYATTTDSNGMYTIYVPSDSQTYRMEFSKEGCADVSMHQIEMNEQLVGGYQAGVYLMPDQLNCNTTIQIYDALNYNETGSGMMQVGSVSYSIRKGINCREGEAYRQGVSDENGTIEINLPAGMYTVQVHKEGYEDTYYILAVRSEGEVTHFNMSPNLASDEMRIVLTWSDMPQDLDSHLFTPYCTADEHISYYHKEDIKGNSLDVDVTNGYGPETVTITNLQRAGLYKYYVADFTDCISGDYSSRNMSYSDASVNVYTEDGLIATFHVPVGKEGVIWEVFEIRNGILIPSQRYYQAVQDKDWWLSK